MDKNLLKKLKSLNNLIGNTPVQSLNTQGHNLFAKLESFNLLDNIKVRPAYYILSKSILSGEIKSTTKIIESSSGNFGLSLAVICNYLSLDFIPVIDPNTSPIYESLLRASVRNVIKVKKRDDTGGFLKTRLSTVHSFINKNPDSFWVNQYGNNNNFLAHYEGIGKEISDFRPVPDYIFVAVSTLGTISGLSTRIKEEHPNCKIVAVDVEGSEIFNTKPQRRHIPGIGSSIHPKFIHKSKIDDVLIIPEFKGIVACWRLLKKEGIFAGGSSGCVYYAAKNYIKENNLQNSGKTFMMIFPDGGYPYTNTIYNSDWIKSIYKEDINC